MDVHDFEFPTDPTTGHVQLVFCERNGNKVSAYSASDGTLRFLAMLAALLGTNRAGLYVFEEIDNGIHPSRQQLLIDLIEGHTASGDYQVITTTHSPDLIELVGTDTFNSTSVVFRGPDTGNAEIHPLAELPNAGRLRQSQGLGRLHRSGWMENAVLFERSRREENCRVNVLIIPEDFRNDQYILRPLFQRLFRSLNRTATVTVCTDPLLAGVSEALKSERLAEIVEQYDGMTDLFILCVDRDGVASRRRRLDQIEKEFGNLPRWFLAENAWEELETWVLAGLDLPSDWRWSDVRNEVSVKERYFAVLARERGVANDPGRGPQFDRSAMKTSTVWRGE